MVAHWSQSRQGRSIWDNKLEWQIINGKNIGDKNPPPQRYVSNILL